MGGGRGRGDQFNGFKCIIHCPPCSDDASNAAVMTSRFWYDSIFSEGGEGGKRGGEGGRVGGVCGGGDGG